MFFRICSSEETDAVARLSSFNFKSHSLIRPVILRVNSTVFICSVPLSEKKESFILCMCNFYKFFTVRQIKSKSHLVSQQKDDNHLFYLLCLLISSRFCSISSYMSTYTGGRCLELSLMLLAPPTLLLSPLDSSPLDAFVDVGSRAPLSFDSDTSGDLILAKPVLRTRNLGIDQAGEKL